jgi:hypothetical protein
MHDGLMSCKVSMQFFVALRVASLIRASSVSLLLAAAAHWEILGVVSVVAIIVTGCTNK